MTRQILFMATSAVAIVIYLGLATYVVTRNPRRSISWVFGGFCLTVACHYLSSLFLFPGPEPSSPVTPLPLRWKWAIGGFMPTFYFHFVSFYFPPPWQRIQSWVLPSAYLGSLGFAVAAIFTDFLVAGPLYRLPSHIIGPVFGPLIYPFAIFFTLEVIAGTAGLIVSYRRAFSPSLRRQIFFLLIPTGLVVLSGVVNSAIVLRKDTGQIPHELGDALFILAAFFYAQAVLRYGSFVGRPMARRDLFYSALAVAGGLVALSLTLTLDHWLAAYTPFPCPIATSILVVIVVVSLPAARRWLTDRLDRLLFKAEREQRTVVRHLAESLSETSDIKGLQAELLGTLCAALGVRDGYVALPESDSPPGVLIVCVVQGTLQIRPGDQIRQPPLHGGKPQLVETLLPGGGKESDWGEVALFCPLTVNPGSGGVLALGEKQNGQPFTFQDLTLCIELTRRVDAASRVTRLREQRDHYLETARFYAQALHRLEEKVITSAQHTLTNWEHIQPEGDVPVAIQILGPLIVRVDGQPIPEAAWETEKAKVLLAYLLWKKPEGATREEISTVLWPQREPEEAANTFHVTLHHLRRVLEPERERTRNSQYIILERGRYRFNSNAPHWLDVTAFETLIKSNELAALKEAISLYRGSYLQDISWALPPDVEMERRRLEAMYLNALRYLAAQIKGFEAATYLERLLAIEPADETAQHALVLNYLSRGRRDLAQRQIQNWRHALAELDLKPSLETMELWQRVEITDGTR